MLELDCFAHSNVSPYSAILPPRFLLKIRLRSFGALLSLFSPAWDDLEPSLEVGFICPFVVIVPFNLCATIVVAQP